MCEAHAQGLGESYQLKQQRQQPERLLSSSSWAVPCPGVNVGEEGRVRPAKLHGHISPVL